MRYTNRRLTLPYLSGEWKNILSGVKKFVVYFFDSGTLKMKIAEAYVDGLLSIYGFKCASGCVNHGKCATDAYAACIRYGNLKPCPHWRSEFGDSRRRRRFRRQFVAVRFRRRRQWPLQLSLNSATNYRRFRRL